MDPDATDQLLNELIPPPGPRGRRIAVWVVFLVLVVLVVTGWRGGVIVPRLEEARWTHWGGGGPVHAGVLVRNGSPGPIEITRGPRPRPGLEPMGYAVGTYEFDQVIGMDRFDPGIDLSEVELDIGALDTDPFPIRIAPHEGVVITVVYDVADCAAILAIEASDTAIDLQVRMVDGPLRRIEHRRQIPMLGATSSWSAALAQYACGFAGTTG